MKQKNKVVFYIGKKKPTMATHLKRNNIDYGYRLVWIKDIHYTEFLKTGQPELMLLSVLAGFGPKRPKEVMAEVVNEVRKRVPDKDDFKKHVEQLHILSNIHNLQQIFVEIMTDISHLIDEKKDPFYQKGKIEGKTEGEIERAIEIAINLIQKSSHDDAFISDITGLPVASVAAIRNLLQQYPDSYKAMLPSLDIGIDGFMGSK